MKLRTALLLAVFIVLPSLGLPAAADHGQWNAAIHAFEDADREQMPAPGSILFIGSSSIERWTSLAADFPGISVVNRGFGGSQISDSTFFADRIVAPYRPRGIVFYAGDNDLQDGHTPLQLRDDFAAFVRTVRALDPGVPIAFVAIKPSVARTPLLPKISAANALVRSYATTQQKVSFLDVHTPMLGSHGQPQARWFGDDGLHMNRAGYALWIGIIRPWIDALPR